MLLDQRWRIKVQIVSFSYIVSSLFNASFNQLFDSAGKKMFFMVCATANVFCGVCNRKCFSWCVQLQKFFMVCTNANVFHGVCNRKYFSWCVQLQMFFVVCATANAPHFSLHHLKNDPFNCIFLKVARCMVWTVRRVFQEFKFKTLAGLKYLVSRKCTGNVVLQNYSLQQLSSLPHADSWFQFVGQKSTVAFTIHCFNFLLTMFKYWPSQIPKRHKREFPCGWLSLELSCRWRRRVHTVHALPFFLRYERVT
jgi:hypothetical protein